jgi:phenylalanine-4-hydroxylase
MPRHSALSSTPGSPPPVTQRIPAHLRPLIAEQDPSLYTSFDHEAWRYIMRIAKAFFKDHAHPVYLQGLDATGISTERIPLISEMDAKLQKFGWRAVPIVGFIPPSAFMELLSLRILGIACDMRCLEHLAYTPAPDIVHEAAGHAPILADPSFAEYLTHYGEIAPKAIYSWQDQALYEAIRELSDLKEDPSATPEQIQAAEGQVEKKAAEIDFVSEAAQVSRMGWWTFEYGLVGTMENPKIYGAGLLSSVGESYHCLNPEVKKIPFSVDCIKQGFDITKPQPQLYVVEKFEDLIKGMEALSEGMAYRIGGLEGLNKAIQARALTTSVLDSGLQISGILGKIRTFENDQSKQTPSYLSYSGPTQLAFEGQELTGHSPNTHASGFGTPLGRIKTPSGWLDPSTAPEAVFASGALKFESGVRVEGKYVGSVMRNQRTLVATFEQCTVRLGSEILFDPGWGTYDMACGVQVSSVHGNAADMEAYVLATGGFKQVIKKPRTNLTPSNQRLHELYSELQALREKTEWSVKVANRLGDLVDEVMKKYPGDWLFLMVTLETLDANLAPKELLGLQQLRLGPISGDAIVKHLGSLKQKSPEIGELIDRGFSILQRMPMQQMMLAP